MKSYLRTVTVRKAVNRFGRLGYVLINEYVKTDDIDRYNKRKHIKFIESKEAEEYLRDLDIDRIYTEDLKVLSRTW